ncbi:MAG: hypothetical protein R3F56_22920 [Planctomycetota bacterium]
MNTTLRNLPLSLGATLLGAIGCLSTQTAAQFTQELHSPETDFLMASYIKHVGNDDIGAGMVGIAQAVLGKSVWSASANAVGAVGIDLFDKSVNFSANTVASASGRYNPGFNVQSRVVAGGFTVYDRTWASLRTETTYDTGRFYIAGGSKTYWLGPIPLRVDGEVGVAAKLNFQIHEFDVTRLYIHPRMKMAAGGAGRLFAGFGFEIKDAITFGAGIEGTMEFGQIELNANVTAQPGTFSGSISADLMPVALRLFLTAFVDITIGRWSIDYELVSYVMDSIRIGSWNF